LTMVKSGENGGLSTESAARAGCGAVAAAAAAAAAAISGAPPSWLSVRFCRETRGGGRRGEDVCGDDECGGGCGEVENVDAGRAVGDCGGMGSVMLMEM
jgi:hypothetical protein